jgi:predicted DNA-binding transcriptional regulator AlpA
MHPLSLSALTVAEFCDKYRINRSTYYRNAKGGRMPPAVKIGHSTRILVEDEEAWLDALRSNKPSFANKDDSQGGHA